MIVLPDIRQSKDYDCGSACIDALFKRAGVRASARLVMYGLGDPIDGTDPTAAECALRKAGIPVLSGSLALDDLRYFTDSDRAVMTPISEHGGHWVVVLGVSRGILSYHDPARGLQKARLGVFESVWHDHTRFGHKYDHWGIVV